MFWELMQIFYIKEGNEAIFGFLASTFQALPNTTASWLRVVQISMLSGVTYPVIPHGPIWNDWRGVNGFEMFLNARRDCSENANSILVKTIIWFATPYHGGRCASQPYVITHRQCFRRWTGHFILHRSASSSTDLELQIVQFKMNYLCPVLH